MTWYQLCAITLVLFTTFGYMPGYVMKKVGLPNSLLLFTWALSVAFLVASFAGVK